MIGLSAERTHGHFTYEPNTVGCIGETLNGGTHFLTRRGDMGKMHERPGEGTSVVFSRRIGHGQLRGLLSTDGAQYSGGWKQKREWL